MRKVAAVVLAVLALGIWILSGSRTQQTVGPDSSTAKAQVTQVAGPTPSATP